MNGNFLGNGTEIFLEEHVSIVNHLESTSTRRANYVILQESVSKGACVLCPTADSVLACVQSNNKRNRPRQNYIFIFWGFRALGNIKNIKFGMKNIK